MGEIGKLGAILLIVASIAATILGYTNEITTEPIQKQMDQANTEARQTVLPQATEFEVVSEEEYKGASNIVEVYKGMNDGNVVGYTIKTTPSGYGGAIEVMVGITTENLVSGVSLGSHQETPGLGAKAAGEFKDQYNGKSTENAIAVIKAGTPKDNEVMSIAGATITSQAVTNGVNSAVNLFNEKLK